MKEQIDNLITIIIPLYNGEEYITRALESVYSQTYGEFEIIIIDDGSTDNGFEICKEFLERNGKITLLEQENSGPGSARNYGLKEARGEFVFFLDADDYIHKDTLLYTINSLRETDTDLVIVEEIIVREDNNCSPNPYLGLPPELTKEYPDYYFCKKESYLQLLINFRKYRNPARKIFYPCKGRLYKSSIIKESNISFPDNTFFMEDLIFQMQYSASSESLVVLKEPYYYYQLHNSPDSITSRFASDKFLPAAQLQYKTTIDLLADETTCSKKEAEKSVSYAIIDDMLVNAIRSAKFITSDNYKWYYNNLSRVVSSSLINRLLKSYSPLPNQSKLIPFLLRFKAIHLLLYILRKKSK